MHKRHLLLGLLAFILSWSASSWAGMDYQGNIQVNEEYNDNVNETNHPKADMVSVVSPTLNLIYDGNRVGGSVAYQGNLRIYDTGQRQNEILNNLDAKGTLAVIDKVLVLDASDNNSMVFNNAAQGTPSSSDSTRNQVNQNIASAGLTFTPNFSERTHPSMGYRVTGTVYGSSQDVNKFTQNAFLDVMHDLTPRMQTGFNLQAERQLAGQDNTTSSSQSSAQGNVTRFTGTAVGNYTYGEGRLVFCRAGAVESVYDDGTTTLYPTWSAGLTHTIGRTTLILQTQADYQNNPSSSSNSFRTTYSASAVYELNRGAITLTAGYSDYFGQGTSNSQDLTLSANLAYELTQRLKLTLNGSRSGWGSGSGSNGLSGSPNQSSSSNNNPIRYYASAQLDYQLPKNFGLQLYYRNKTTLANQFQQNGGNGNVNIVGVGISKSF